MSADRDGAPCNRPVGEVPPTDPESYCHRCGGPNASWWVPSPVWNLVMGYPEQIHGGIVCPLCFAALAEAQGARGPWRVAPRVWPEGVALVHVDGRVWDEATERWVVRVGANRDSEEIEALREQVAHRDTLLDNAARLLANRDTDPRTYQALLTQLHEVKTREAALRAGVEAGEASDGHHTHRELYEYRMLYNAHAAHGWLAAGIPVVKSRRHSDGEPCFGGGWFIVTATLPTGQVSNHYRDEHWSLFDVPAVDLPPEYDGHTPADAADRLRALLDGEVRP